MLSLLAACALFTPLPLQRAPERPPNLLLILADDLGWRDLGVQGTGYCETPSLDRLAREGTRFTAGYASAGNCAPSRVCLMTGQYTPRHGVYFTRQSSPSEELASLVPVRNPPSLDASNRFVADVLREAGYATGIFGKWHLGSPQKGSGPRDRGFEVAFVPSPDGPRLGPDPKRAFSITEAACAFLEASRDRPFFAVVSHHAVHKQLQARPESLQRFRAKATGGEPCDPLYAACVWDLDEAVGRLLAKLDELGLRESTLVVFTSDNGATADSSQAPLRGEKGNYYEASLRVPFLVRWPGVATPGSTCDVPVIGVDLFPTFLEAAGASAPAGKVLDGRSLVPLLRGEPFPERALHWHFPGYLVEGRSPPELRATPVSAIRRDRWKLLLHHEPWLLEGGRERVASNGAVELFDLEEDPGEAVDLSLRAEETRDALLDELLAWIRETDAPFPTPRVVAEGTAERGER